MGKQAKNFGQGVLGFYQNLRLPECLPCGVSVIAPHSDPAAWACTELFFSEYFSDTRDRVFVMGINPGRFGSGCTGVPFTDADALDRYCGIPNDLPRHRELSSEFIYMVIQEWGGAKAFFREFFLTAVSPVGFTKDGRNYNYYSDRDILGATRPFIVETLKQQIALGAHHKVVLLGAGQNAKAFGDLNGEYRLFKDVEVLEHPRYVMQYKRRTLKCFVAKYCETLARALGKSSS